MDTLKQNQSGFGLIQVIIAGTLMSAMALGMAGLIASQSQQISYMEDRMSHLSLRAEVENFIKNNIENCTQMITGKKLPAANKELPVPMTDKDGNVIYDPQDPTKNTIDKLVLNKIYMRDVDVASSGTGSGNVEFVVEAERIRRGGGPTEMLPIVVEMPVAMDTATNELTGCQAGGGLAGITGCLTRDLKAYIATEDCRAGMNLAGYPSSTSAVNAINCITQTYKIPDTVRALTLTALSFDAYQTAESGSRNPTSTACPAESTELTIYPGITMINGKVLKAGSFISRRIVNKGYGVRTSSSGNSYYTPNWDEEYYYDGQFLGRKVSANWRGTNDICRKSLQVAQLGLSFNSVLTCPQANARNPASIPENLGFTLYEEAVE